MLIILIMGLNTNLVMDSPFNFSLLERAKLGNRNRPHIDFSVLVEVSNGTAGAELAFKQVIC